MGTTPQRVTMTLSQFSPSSCKGELGINRDGEGAARVEQVRGEDPRSSELGTLGLRVSRDDEQAGESAGSSGWCVDGTGCARHRKPPAPGCQPGRRVDGSRKPRRPPEDPPAKRPRGAARSWEQNQESLRSKKQSEETASRGKARPPPPHSACGVGVADAQA